MNDHEYDAVNIDNDHDNYPPLSYPDAASEHEPIKLEIDDEVHQGDDKMSYTDNEKSIDNTFQEASISHTPTKSDDQNHNTDGNNNASPKTDQNVTQSPSNKEIQRSMFGDAFTRCVYFACSLFIFSILSFALWFFNVDNNLEAGFGLSAFGALVIFFGGLGGIILSILHKINTVIPFQWILLYVSLGLYIMGGIIYFVGGCVLAAAYNQSGTYSTSYSGTWFGEALFVGAHAIIAGVDLWKQSMDSKGLRVFIYGSLYFVVALILFFCYAIISDEAGGASITGLIACGYFFGMIVVLLYISIRICPMSIINKLATPTMDLILSIAFVVSIFFSVIGYWAIAGKSGISEFSAYWIGFSLFLALTGTQIGLDFKWSGYAAFAK